MAGLCRMGLDLDTLLFSLSQSLGLRRPTWSRLAYGGRRLGRRVGVKSRELADGGVGVKRSKIIKRDGLLKLGGATPFVEYLYKCEDVRGSVSRAVFRIPIADPDRGTTMPGGGLWDIRY